MDMDQKAAQAARAVIQTEANRKLKVLERGKVLYRIVSNGKKKKCFKEYVSIDEWLQIYCLPS